MTYVYRLPRWLPTFLVIVAAAALFIFVCSSCGALGLATADDLRAMAKLLEDGADRQDDLERMSKHALEVAQAVPGWGGVAASAVATTLAGMGTLNKVRNLTRASDPRVSNLVKEAPRAS